MYGAILGDIIGSRFEFVSNADLVNFDLFTDKNRVTDDTVMTIAVGAALLKAGMDADAETTRLALIDSMQAWGRRYPRAGYGGRFYSWLSSRKQPQPYYSYGNGSAMRVSPAGWLYPTMERTRGAARITAEVTHNHPEGIKGAECTAAVIFLARTGCSKDEIREYVTREFGYDLSEPLEQLRFRNRRDVSCMDSLPKALTAFLTAESYESAVRNAISLGGDTDTIAAIAGSMAEAMFGIPAALLAKGMTYVPEEMQTVLKAFDRAIGRIPQQSEDPYARNVYIRQAVAAIHKNNTRQDFADLLNVLAKRMLEYGEAPTPMVDVNHVVDSLNPEEIHLGDTFTFDQDVRLQFDTMTDSNGDLWFPLFTDTEELYKGQTTNFIMNASIQVILENGLHSDRVKGIVINPFGQPLTLTKELLQILMNYYGSLQ